MSASIVPSPPQQLSTVLRLGASSAAAAIGMSPWSSPIQAWQELTGRRAPFAGNEATRWGTILEPVIRAVYVETFGVTVHVPPTSLFHRNLPWLSATPDGIVLAADGSWQYVAPQVKNVGLRQSDRWEDGPPTEYYVQAVVEMAVTDLPRLDFAVLVGGQDFRTFTVERDLDVEASVIEACSTFWEHVTSDTPPPVDGSEAYFEYLAEKAAKHTGAIDADAGARAAIERWHDIERQAKALKAEAGEIKNALLAQIVAGNATSMRSPLGEIRLGAGANRTSWKDVAEELGATPDLIKKHTETASPSLNRPKHWTKEK